MLKRGKNKTSKTRILKMKQRRWDYLIYTILIIIVVLALAPVLWMFSSSLKSIGEFYDNRWLWPKEITPSNYVHAWQGTNFKAYLLNSVVITGAAVGMMVLIGSMAACAISRYEFRGANKILYLFLGGQIVPPQAVLIPVLAIFKYLHLVGTQQGLILVYVAAGLPFTVFLLQGFFRTLPKELEESARVDGANELIIFWKILLPLARPALGAVIIFQSIWVWNEFLFALVFYNKPGRSTLSVGILAIVGEYFTDYPMLMAALCLSVIPVIVIFLMFSRYFVKGITAGSVKG